MFLGKEIENNQENHDTNEMDEELKRITHGRTARMALIRAAGLHLFIFSRL
jgi:hypothetical protein